MLKTLLYLLFFFLPTQLGKHFWFDFSYKLSQRIDYLAPTIYFTDILVFLIIGIFIKQNWQRIKLKVSLRLGFFTFLFFTAVIYWLWQKGENPYLLFYNLIKLVELTLLVFIISRVFKLVDFPQIIKILNFALIIQVSLAFYQVLVEKSAGLWIIGERDFGIYTIGIAKFLAPTGKLLLRGYGTFPHPNVFGGFSLLLLIANSFLFLLRLSPVLKNQNLKKRSFLSLSDNLIFLLGFILSLLGIWLSMSILVIFASQLFLIFLGLKFFKKLEPLKLTALILPLVLVIGLFVGGLGVLKSESVNRRMALLAVASEEFSRSPIFGVGLGNFIPAMPERPLSLNDRIYFWQPVHNLPALILVETGLLGFLVVAWLAWRLVKKIKAQRLKLKGGFYRSFFLILVSWWVIFAITGMFDHYWLTLQQGRLMLALMIGLSLIKK